MKSAMKTTAIWVAKIAMLCIFSYQPLRAVTISGGVIASSVNVSGNITVSSITISTLTVTNLLNLPAKIPGTIAQMKFSSSTVSTAVSSTTFMPVSNIYQSITLSRPTSYVRISLTGNLSTILDSDQPAYITIFRDTINLGDASLGLSDITLTNSLSNGVLTLPVGIQILDAPGDTNAHTYQPYIRVSTSGHTAEFPYEGTGYLLLEEITQGLEAVNPVNSSTSANVMVLRGPITANDVTVTGDVSVSSMSISSLTVSNFLNAQPSVFDIPGITRQVKFSSTSARFDTTSSTYVAIPDMNVTLSLSRPTNYVRISINGVLSDSTINGQLCWLSVSRDSTVLVPEGLAVSEFKPSPVGITFVDSPGDTSAHTYRAVLRRDCCGVASFTMNPIGYFLVEEIVQ